MVALHIYITPGFLQIIGESCGKVHAEQLLEIDKEPGAARLSSRVKESRYRPEKIIFDSWYRTELYFQPFQIYCTRVVSQSIIPKLWWRKLRLSSTNNWKKFVIGEFMGCFEVCSGMECFLTCFTMQFTFPFNYSLAFRVFRDSERENPHENRRDLNLKSFYGRMEI